MNYFKYIRQPKFYGEFKCIGSKCKSNCCYGWNIDWERDEVEKVLNAPNCPADLKEMVEEYFVPKPDKSENAFIVKFDERGKCPCVTEDGLCRVQKELGAEYLSEVCMKYPRYITFLDPNNAMYRGIFLSCPEVVRMIVNDEKAMELVNIPPKQSDTGTKTILHIMEDTDIAAHPELKYRAQIVEFFYELIGDKKCSVETNIALGALVAKNLSDLIGNKEYDRIPEALKVFRKQTHYAEGLNALESMEPDYKFSLGVTSKIVESALGFKMTNVVKNANGNLDVNLYLAGKARLDEMMKDNTFWLRNIALALVLELCVPFRKKNYSVFDNYRFFAAAFASIKLNAIAAALVPDKSVFQLHGQEFCFEGMEKLYGTTGILFRTISQGYNTFDDVIKVINEFELNSPMHFAMLVK